jgi:DNA (cytosine-5)-methyltransferase 1
MTIPVSGLLSGTAGNVRIGSLFSGYGGLDLAALDVFGGSVAWHAEIDEAPQKILAHHWPDVPNLGDVTQVKWSPFQNVDVLIGGFPCQDVSLAGKQAGMGAGTRSGLWFEFLRAIEALRPGVVVAENVRGLLSATTDTSREVVSAGPKGGRKVGHTDRALGRVLADLADVGYDASWHGVRASDAGAPHQRFRVFIVAWPADSSSDGRDERRPEPAGVVGGPRTAQCGAAVPSDAPDVGHQRGGVARYGGSGSADGGDDAADTDGGVVREQPVGQPGGGSEAVAQLTCADVPAHAHCDGRSLVGRQLSQQRHSDGRRSADVAWGKYEPAVRQWEQLTRPAPRPTDTSPRGGERLSPQFVEWMMGLPDGWVTDVPGISRNDQLKALGNGVVPQQAALGIRAAASYIPKENAA